ncbi:DMT family transporter [Candidatus Purcelliella pentastirinorum]|uniref:DMT family transporter n=1 Tax=Candidatus Purcelliella pentastirinorum TaxID=472834 RepID=A0AAX3N839_9ENTR|nr:DMT family transporter [Candidatus Purcelliella pentastirinorum]WDI78548.1 DMT family transporter [Candidatus Purcelliella pentastirinorum]WDR80423.1 DMT family transporter [Candidatus Purcelliella pentastirinorum]
MYKLITFGLFSTVTLTWGTTWIIMKIVIETIPPIFATGIRFIITAPILIIIAKLTKKPLLFPVGEKYFQIIITIFYFTIPFTLMIYSEKYINSGLASIIFANMPIAILIASKILTKEKTNKKQILGLIIAITSLSIILFTESKINKTTHWLGFILIIIPIILHAILYVESKKKYSHVSIITFNTIPTLCSGIILLFMGWFIENPKITNFSIDSILAIFYLGVIGGVCGVMCYFTLQKRISTFKSSIVFILFPLISITLENYIYNHKLSTISIFALIPLIISTIVITIPKDFLYKKI